MIKLCSNLSSLRIFFYCLVCCVLFFFFDPGLLLWTTEDTFWEWESEKAHWIEMIEKNIQLENCAFVVIDLCWDHYTWEHIANKTTETVNIKPIVLLMLVDTYKSISVQILVNRNNYYLQNLCTYNIHLKRYGSIFLCFRVAFYFLSFASCCFAFIFSDGVSVLVICLTHSVPRNSKHLCYKEKKK